MYTLFLRIAFKSSIDIETMCINITSLFLRIFLQFGGPIEQFDIGTKLSLEFMMFNYPPPPPVQKDLSN